MLRIKQAIIVEGKYDKIKLKSIIDAVIITTDGFGIFKNKEKMELIRSLAEKNGIVIITDSDKAGFRIRDHIKGSVPVGSITNIYIPQIKGKERRKSAPSKEGTLGVEGMDRQTLIKAFENAGIIPDSEKPKKEEFLSRQKMFEDGLIGADSASEKRRILLKALGLPSMLSVTSMIEVINTVFTEKEYAEALSKSLNK